MTILSDVELYRLLQAGSLLVDPILSIDSQISGSKVDLRLDSRFAVLRSEQDGTWAPNHPKMENHSLPLHSVEVDYTKPFVLHPGNFVLGQTLEVIGIPDDFMGRIEGRSSFARHGILIHATASIIDPGFHGHICLELFNLGQMPVELFPMMRIGALTIERIEGTVHRPYRGATGGGFAGEAVNATLNRAPDEDFRRIAEAFETTDSASQNA